MNRIEELNFVRNAEEDKTGSERKDGTKSSGTDAEDGCYDCESNFNSFATPKKMKRWFELPKMEPNHRERTH